MAKVEFRLLGPVEVWNGDRCLDAGRPHQRAVLAALLVAPGPFRRYGPRHDGLALAQHALNHPEQAGAHWQHALDTLSRLGVDQSEPAVTTVASIFEHLDQLETPRDSH